MANYSAKASKKPSPVIWIILGVVLAVILLVVTVRTVYHVNLRPVSASERSQLVTIPSGASASEIATELKKAGVIRQAWAFEWYIRNNDLRDRLQAGTYAIKPSQSTPDIAQTITNGQVATDTITILPGKRLDQIRQSFINNGFKAEDVDHALNPALYKDHPALVDKPEGASLEGYLFPDTFQKMAETKPETIIRASLDEMQAHLTPELRKAYVAQGLTVHQGVTLASIITQELSKPEDQAKAAQVFLKRLREDIVLGSDVTALYGAVVSHQKPSFTYDSPYNTHLHRGLPPGPISNVTANALKAVANPAQTDYLFFVAGDDGTTYFSRTLAEHEALTAEHCKKLCSITPQ